jgi:hypothetical protein
MGFQYTQLETFSHSTSLENLLNYDCLRQLIDTHSPTHLKVRKKKKQKTKKTSGSWPGADLGRKQQQQHLLLLQSHNTFVLQEDDKSSNSNR